jgi:hypothetical protein
MLASSSPLLRNFFSHVLRTPSNILVRTDLGFGKEILKREGKEEGRKEEAGLTLAALIPLEIVLPTGSFFAFW